MVGMMNDDTDQIDMHRYFNPDEESIENDIVQGKDFKVIARKWEISLGRVRNVASDMRDRGIPIPRRNTKKWRRISIVRVDDIK
jgi:hypothetical protein